MSMDYGTVNGYGIRIDDYDEDKMLEFLLNAECLKEYVDEPTLDDFEDYEYWNGQTGVLYAFVDAVNEYVNPKLWDENKDNFEIHEDDEDGCFYLVYIPDYFPTRPVSKETIDGIFKDIMEKTGIKSEIDYQHIHWNG